MFENVFNNIDRALRTEQGVASELDYAEQTSWLLFLKYLDDLEATRADKAELEGKDHAPIIEEKFRWRAWAAPLVDGKIDQNAKTGDDLILFVKSQTSKQCVRFCAARQRCCAQTQKKILRRHIKLTHQPAPA